MHESDEYRRNVSGVLIKDPGITRGAKEECMRVRTGGGMPVGCFSIVLRTREVKVTIPTLICRK